MQWCQLCVFLHLQLLILRVKIENEGKVGMYVCMTMIGVSEMVTPLKL